MFDHANKPITVCPDPIRAAAKDIVMRLVDMEGADIEMIDADIAHVEQAIRREVEPYEEALIWCSGSGDFAPGGKARKGWLKLCRPLLDRIRQGGK